MTPAGLRSAARRRILFGGAFGLLSLRCATAVVAESAPAPFRYEEYEIVTGVAGGCCPDRPSPSRRIALDGAPSHTSRGGCRWTWSFEEDGTRDGGRRPVGQRAFNRTLLIGDITGDGRSDLLLEWTHRQSRVYAGVPGPELFAPRSQSVAVSLPNDAEYVWLTDLNRDGVQDLLLHHVLTLRDAHGAPQRPPGTEPQRVTTLISRP